MKYSRILVTGGCGFVGSNISLRLKKEYPDIEITAFDNLYRKGSELNIPRLEEKGIRFINGDVRNRNDLDILEEVDLVIECSAEPSVLAGRDSSPEYLVDTNLVGAVNCLELARKRKADFVFFSTSRVYPVEELNRLNYIEGETRFELSPEQTFPGVSARGIAEEFPLGKIRTLYGATKLASELLIREYGTLYGICTVINRCGVISGPWQFGKVDQGFLVLWMARHFFNNQNLTYIGYGGLGKQVRDFLHIDDLCIALQMQLEHMESMNGETFNIGGGLEMSTSLREATDLCREITGNTFEIRGIAEDRPGDIPLYISDYSKFNKITEWSPKRGAKRTLQDIFDWIQENEKELGPLLN